MLLTWIIYVILHDHFRNASKIGDIPAKENVAYSDVSVKRDSLNQFAAASIFFERDPSYPSKHTVQNPLYDDIVLQERVYDTVDEKSSQKLAFVKLNIFNVLYNYVMS